jgi:hypothetical protein
VLGMDKGMDVAAIAAQKAAALVASSPTAAEV